MIRCFYLVENWGQLKGLLGENGIEDGWRPLASSQWLCDLQGQPGSRADDSLRVRVILSRTEWPGQPGSAAGHRAAAGVWAETQKELLPVDVSTTHLQLDVDFSSSCL